MNYALSHSHDQAVSHNFDKIFPHQGKTLGDKSNRRKKARMARAERNGMANSNSAKAGGERLIGCNERINVSQARLPGVVLCVLWLCFVVLGQGTANAAATPEAASTQNAVMLNSIQTVSMMETNSPANQSLAQRVNGGVELVALVSEDGKAVADQQTKKKSPEGQDRTAEDVEKELTHKVWLLGVMHLSMLLIGIRVGGGPGALEEVFFQLRDIYRFFGDIIRPVRKLATSTKTGHAPPRPFPPRLP